MEEGSDSDPDEGLGRDEGLTHAAEDEEEHSPVPENGLADGDDEIPEARDLHIEAEGEEANSVGELAEEDLNSSASEPESDEEAVVGEASASLALVTVPAFPVLPDNIGDDLDPTSGESEPDSEKTLVLGQNRASSEDADSYSEADAESPRSAKNAKILPAAESDEVDSASDSDGDITVGELENPASYKRLPNPEFFAKSRMKSAHNDKELGRWWSQAHTNQTADHAAISKPASDPVSRTLVFDDAASTSNDEGKNCLKQFEEKVKSKALKTTDGQFVVKLCLSCLDACFFKEMLAAHA